MVILIVYIKLNTVGVILLGQKVFVLGVNSVLTRLGRNKYNKGNSFTL